MSATGCDTHTFKVGIITEERTHHNVLRRLLQQCSDFSWAWTEASAHAAIMALHSTAADVILIIYPFASQMCFADIRELKAVSPRVRIILIVDFIADSAISEALVAGINGFLFIPVSSKAFAKSCTTVLSNCVKSLKPHGKTLGANGNRTRLPHITKRQKEILAQVAAGKADKEIAAMLGLSVLTVNRHLHNIYKKHDLRNRTQAICLIK